MRKIMWGSALAVAMSIAAHGAAAQSPTRFYPDGARSAQTGARSPGSRAQDTRLGDYLQGITLTRPEEVRVDRAWGSYGTLDQRLDGVRSQLARSQQQRFDSNRARIEGGYGTYGTYGSSGAYGTYGNRGGYGTYDQRDSHGSYDAGDSRESSRRAADRLHGDRDDQSRAGQYTPSTSRRDDEHRQDRNASNSANHHSDRDQHGDRDRGNNH